MPKIRTTAEPGRAPLARRLRAPAAVVRALGVLLAPILPLACQSAPESRVPYRTAARSVLLEPMVGCESDPRLAARNDDRLGTRRDAFVRLQVEVESATLDRQWILNGRPFDRFRTTTVTRERLVR